MGLARFIPQFSILQAVSVVAFISVTFLSQFTFSKYSNLQVRAPEFDLQIQEDSIASRALQSVYDRPVKIENECCKTELTTESAGMPLNLVFLQEILERTERPAFVARVEEDRVVEAAYIPRPTFVAPAREAVTAVNQPAAVTSKFNLIGYLKLEEGLVFAPGDEIRVLIQLQQGGMVPAQTDMGRAVYFYPGNVPCKSVFAELRTLEGFIKGIGRSACLEPNAQKVLKIKPNKRGTHGVMALNGGAITDLKSVDGFISGSVDASGRYAMRNLAPGSSGYYYIQRDKNNFLTYLSASETQKMNLPSDQVVGQLPIGRGFGQILLRLSSNEDPNVSVMVDGREETLKILERNQEDVVLGISVRAGIYQIQLKDDPYNPEKVFAPVQAGLSTYLESENRPIELAMNISQDPIDAIWSYREKPQVMKAETKSALIRNAINAPFVLDFKLSTKTFTQRVALDRSQRHYDISVMQDEKLYEWLESMRLTGTALVGRVGGRQKYRVFDAQNTAKVFFFNADTKAVRSENGEPGDFFLLKDLPEGFNTIYIEPEDQSSLYQTTMMIGRDAVSFMQYTFSN